MVSPLFQPQIFAKGSTSFVLSSEELCFSCGLNNYGELGVGDKTDRSSLTSLNFPLKFKSISCGLSFNLCLTENNLCYVWRRNNYGQLGLGDTNNRSIPILFSLPNNEKISFITCGYSHTICLTENNLCYVWGYNDYGQLGLGDTNNRYRPTLLTLPI